MHSRISYSFTTILLKTFVTESAAYVFICVFFCNIHIWDVWDVDHVWSLFNTDLSYILSILLEIVKCSNKYIFWCLYMCCFYYTHTDYKNIFLSSLFRFSKTFHHRYWIMWYLLYTTLWMYSYEKSTQTATR